MTEKMRANYLLQSERMLLEDWCIHVWRMFGTAPYLVGSAITTRDFRDVDVRVLLDADEWKAMFPALDDCDGRDARWTGFCTAISIWGQKVTGLPIDFQIQPQDKANEEHNGQREALGMGYEGYELNH